MNTREFLVETVENLQKMQARGLHYLSFFLMKDAIQLLGTLSFESPINLDAINPSDFTDRPVFDRALERYPSLHKYAELIEGPHDLYEGFGKLLHLGHGIVITQASDPENGQDHMKVLSFNGTPRLVLVCEELLADIQQAVKFLSPEAFYEDFMHPKLRAD